MDYKKAAHYPNIDRKRIRTIQRSDVKFNEMSMFIGIVFLYGSDTKKRFTELFSKNYFSETPF